MTPLDATIPLLIPFVSARFVRAVDGDTYVMTLAWKRSWEKGATVEHVRLEGWRAREHNQAAEYDADGGGLLRVSGAAATAIATEILTAATHLVVGVRGLDMYGRILGDVRLDNGYGLGPTLAERKVVTPGVTSGDAHRP